MELYDKKYVYFEWDDKLEGKDVFCGFSIYDLKSQVNQGNAQTGVLHHSNNSKGHPFVPTWSDGSGSLAYPFAYYDPYYEVKKAYNEGKKIQYKSLRSTKKTDNEKEMYKGFFRNIEERIEKQDIPLEDKLIITLVDMENMISYMRGGVNNDVHEFVNVVRESIRPNIVEPVKNCRCKESEEYEIPGFESKQEKPTYNASSSKPHSFPCQSCTKVNEECIPTDFEGGGCGECPKYENRIWANILKNKEPEKDRYLTNKELTMWLAKDNGQWKHTKYDLIGTSYTYVGHDDEGVDYLNIRVRKWEDENWYEPTYNYCFGGK